jgi:hypothetical protein
MNKYNIKIIVSLTTIPSRLPLIKNTLKSLTLFSKNIIINIPYFCKKEQIKYDIPIWLHDMKNIIINRCDDYGPITKLLPTLQYASDNDYILICDDDIIYNKKWYDGFILYNKKYPNSIIFYESFKTIDFYDSINLEIEIFEAYKGVLIPKKMINKESILKLISIEKQCFYSDDLILSFYAFINNFSLFKIPKSYYKSSKYILKDLNHYNNPSTSLNKGISLTGGNHHNYNIALKYLIIRYYLNSEIESYISLNNCIKETIIYNNILKHYENIDSIDNDIFEKYNTSTFVLWNIDELLGYNINKNDLVNFVNLNKFNIPKNIKTDLSILTRNIYELLNLLAFYDYKILIVYSSSNILENVFMNDVIIKKINHGYFYLFKIKKSKILCLTNNYKYYTNNKFKDSYLNNYEAIIKNYNCINSMVWILFI